MQNGDLEEFSQDRLIVVLEGILALVVDEKDHTRWRKRERTVAYHIQWHEIPLKRLVMMQDRYPSYVVEIVTFKSEKLADMAAEFLNDARVPYASIGYRSWHEFITLLKFQRDIKAIFDTEPERLDHYGQLGIASVRGMDFSG